MTETTAGGQAYALLKNAILNGVFKPGDHLREEQLASAYGVSRTPVRQAMKRLADEGLIQNAENKRSYVTDVNALELEQMFDVMGMLESYSAGLAAVRITDEELAVIKSVQAELEEDYFKGDPKDDRSYLQHNSRFHNAIHQCNGNPRLQALVENLVEIPASMFIKFGRVTDSEVSIDYHRKIIAALQARDRRLTELLMRTHIESVRREYRELLRQFNEDQNQSEKQLFS